MDKTRFSLFYLAGYLIIGGVGFLFAPKIVLQLFMSNGDYHDLILRMAGVLLIVIGTIIVQIIRFRITELYKTTLMVRIFIIVSFLTLYNLYNDPMMLVLTFIVGIGFLFTLFSYNSDLRAQKD